LGPLKHSTVTVAESQASEAALSELLFTDSLQLQNRGGGRGIPPCAGPGFLWRCVNLLERTAAGFLLLALLPFLLAIALILFALSGRSPFVAHRRVGRNGRELWVLKFRTMWDAAGSGVPKLTFVERISCGSESSRKNSSDPRVTSAFAALCRKYSIDELPQLWHVLRGDMALIGPRPLTSEELLRFYRSDAPRLLVVRPGLSGLWQVNGRSKLTLEERRRLDIFMLENWSLKLYMQILQATVPCVLSGRDAW
jgi:exopolysaccharide production protein ExoY